MRKILDTCLHADSVASCRLRGRSGITKYGDEIRKTDTENSNVFLVGGRGLEIRRDCYECEVVYECEFISTKLNSSADARSVTV